MTSSNDDLVLEIENNSSGRESQNTFTPRSITERALALGGRVSVNSSGGGSTIVSVVIPM